MARVLCTYTMPTWRVRSATVQPGQLGTAAFRSVGTIARRRAKSAARQSRKREYSMPDSPAHPRGRFSPSIAQDEPRRPVFSQPLRTKTRIVVITKGSVRSDSKVFATMKSAAPAHAPASASADRPLAPRRGDRGTRDLERHWLAAQVRDGRYSQSMDRIRTRGLSGSGRAAYTAVGG